MKTFNNCCPPDYIFNCLSQNSQQHSGFMMKSNIYYISSVGTEGTLLESQIFTPFLIEVYSLSFSSQFIGCHQTNIS